MMRLFDDSSAARVYATPIGTDLCTALIAGLDARLTGQPPEALARVQIYVANARMHRRLQALYAAGPPRLLPRLTPVLALAERGALAGLPPAIPPLRLRLELADLIGRLLDVVPDLAPRSAIYDLADSLADLMGEMFEEGVTPERIAALDVGEHSRHWRRAQQFLGAVSRYFGDGAVLTREARQSVVVDRLIHDWKIAPPDHPVIVAGSTGSRGATARLMEAVACLPQGAVILPGHDPHLPAAIWPGLLTARRDGLAGEDHPQYRLARFAARVGIDPAAIPDWHPTPSAPGASVLRARARAISLALRPAPVTDQWRTEGPDLTDLAAAMADVTLLEAPTPQIEAAAIALRLREAAETGQTAALVSPDRRLTRQVAAALDRWSIRPDDSAGEPLGLSAGGRFLRHVAEAMTGPVNAELLVTLLKHPQCHAGDGRGQHLQRTRDLELAVRRRRTGAPNRAMLVDWAMQRSDDTDAMEWVSWLAQSLLRPTLPPGAMPLTDRVAAHLDLAEALARGSGGDGAGPAGTLYDGEEGAALARLAADLRAEAPAGDKMTARDYLSFFSALAADREVRQAVRPHAHILIWGTQEARVQGADLMILAGLNEGVWPSAPAADPWLNRAMRAEAGLRLPDRVIGLSAHDFQQATGAREVWLSRARRDDETDTVPSRWLNRIINLLRGASAESAAALEAMRARGADCVARAEALAAPDKAVDPAPRPAPCPPVAARPTRLSVTEVEKLIRDPYAIYARRVLRLTPLDPLRAAPDSALRGTVLHRVLKAFVEETRDALPPFQQALDLLMRHADAVLATEAPWPAAQRLWRARLARVAPWFVAGEAERRALGTPRALERAGEWHVPGCDLLLRGTADRIDRLHDGGYAIYDYKTGQPPTEQQELAFNKQLWLEALMAEAGAFGLDPPGPTRRIAYIGLGSSPTVRMQEPSREDLVRVSDGFRQRIAHMQGADTGFPSRRAVEGVRFPGDYDHLARHGEWDETATPTLIRVGRTNG